jgi:hypothetical protein
VGLQEGRPYGAPTSVQNLVAARQIFKLRV